MTANDYDYRKYPPQSQADQEPYGDDLGFDNEIKQIIKDLDDTSGAELVRHQGQANEAQIPPFEPGPQDYPGQAPAQPPQAGPYRPQGPTLGPPPGPPPGPPGPTLGPPQAPTQGPPPARPPFVSQPGPPAWEQNPPQGPLQGAPQGYAADAPLGTSYQTPPQGYAAEAPLGTPYQAPPQATPMAYPGQTGPAQGPPPRPQGAYPGQGQPAPAPGPRVGDAFPDAYAGPPNPVRQGWDQDPPPSPGPRQGSQPLPPPQREVLTARNPVPAPRPPAQPLDDTLVLPDGYGIGPAKVHDVIDLIDEVEIPTLRATGLGDRKVSDLTASELERLIEAAVERALLKATK